MYSFNYLIVYNIVNDPKNIIHKCIYMVNLYIHFFRIIKYTLKFIVIHILYIIK